MRHVILHPGSLALAALLAAAALVVFRPKAEPTRAGYLVPVLRDDDGALRGIDWDDYIRDIRPNRDRSVARITITYSILVASPHPVEAVMLRKDPRIVDGYVVTPEEPIQIGRRFAAIYAKEVIEHIHAWPSWLTGLRRALLPGGRLWLSTPNYGEPWLPTLESTVLELVARKSGFSRRHIHPTRFSKRSLQRGLEAAGFDLVQTRVTPTRFAITAWAQAPR